MPLVEVELPLRLPWQRRLFEAVESDARFIVAVMGRRAGKTHAASELAGFWALKGKQVFWGAPTHDTASIGREKFLELWSPVILSQRTHPQAEARLVSGGKILWRSFDREGAALGRGIDLAIIDEAARVKKRIVYEDLLPTLADTGGKCLAITTPRGRKSWVFDWYQRAKSGDPKYAVVHGPSTENPAPEIREFIETVRQEMPEHLFRQEFLAEFIEGEGAVFRNIRACATLPGWRDEPTPGARYIIGCDLAKHEDFTVLVAQDLSSGEFHGFERFHRIDWLQIIARVRAFAERWGGTVWIDSTGVGDPVFDQLAAEGVPLAPVKFSNESKAQLIVGLATSLERGEIAFPDDDLVVGELEAFAYEELPSGRYRYSAPEGMHDDIVIAMALANHGRIKAGNVFAWVG